MYHWEIASIGDHGFELESPRAALNMAKEAILPTSAWSVL